MSMIPVEGAPGLFRDTNTGKIFNHKDFTYWETSDRFEGVKLALPASTGMAILKSWSLSVVKQPQPLELQQLVVLKNFDRVLATALVRTLLQAPVLFLPPQLLLEDTITEVFLQERPIEGAGLRLHLHGYIRRPVR